MTLLTADTTISPEPTLRLLDLSVLLTYLAGVVLFGCWFVRKSGTSREFMVAGGTLPGWAVGLSIFGTYLSSNTFLGVPGKAYGGNFNGFLFSLTLPIAAFLAVRYFVPFYRHRGEISAYTHLEHRFGSWARTYAVVCYILTQLARTGAILFGVALGLHALTGWDIAWIIVLTGLLVTVYTLLGGIEAVIWTDVVQSIILTVGAVLVLVLLLFATPGGPSEVFSVAVANDKFSLGSWAFDLTTSTVWVMLLYGVFINLTNFGIDQSFIQRYHTARSDREAARSLWFGALLYVPISLLFFLIGALLFSYYQVSPEQRRGLERQVAASELPADATPEQIDAHAADLGPAEVGDKALPRFITYHLPPGVAGLLIAAIVAAAMSSIDTSLNSSATVFLKDIYIRYINPNISERGTMAVLRLATVGVGVIGTGAALALIGVKSVLDAWWQMQGIFAGGLLGLFLLGIVSRRATSAIALTSVLLGVLVIAWMTFSANESWLPPFLRSPLHTNMIIVVGTLTIFLTGLILARLFGTRGNHERD